MERKLTFERLVEVVEENEYVNTYNDLCAWVTGYRQGEMTYDDLLTVHEVYEKGYVAE